MKQKSKKHILWFKDISKRDIALVGGKNGSLGEMFSQLTQKGIQVPDGLALTAKAYWRFLQANNLLPKLKEIFDDFDPKNIESLQKTGKLARELILRNEIPEDLKKEILAAYQKLGQKYNQKDVEVAVRTSGVAEDSPTTSFAGQFETFLNITGKDKLFWAIKQSIASTFTDRAIAYREGNKIPQLKFALSIGVQKMVRSDLASSGIIFTLDTESGFDKVVLINAIYGVGEMIVKGRITPDEFQVFKPSLERGYPAIIVKNLGRKDKKYVFAASGLKEAKVPQKDQLKVCLNDEEVLTLGRWAVIIEKHYRAPQDIEWAKDGKTGQLFIVQSRPETIHSAKQQRLSFEEYELATDKKPILEGIAIGEKVGKGKAKIIFGTKEFSKFQKGEVLVTKMTDPDWLPLMRIASSIVTDEGGKTCHAAIISRELGIPAVIGVKVATKILKTGDWVTVDCSSGKGKVFSGDLPFKIKKYNLKKIPKTKTKVMVNIGAPEIAFKSSFLPVEGVGLARLEFIITEKIKIHPLALHYFKRIKARGLKSKIDELTLGYKDKKQFFVDELAEGISQIAAAFWPKPVIIRLSDFKSNEYAKLIGGELFEPKEENPMLGLRGASRYYDEKFRPAFKMECDALKKARDIFGLKNIWLMVPFCRTPEEGEKVLKILTQNGLEKGKDGLKIVVMAEIPSNALLAEQFLQLFDGFSIGSNDLTQLILGLDRDSSLVAKIGDERNQAVKQMVTQIITVAKENNKYIGICGEAPANFPEFTEFLVKEGIESISVNPDSVIKTIINVAKVEKHYN
jgi:pyruvate,water dikinase